MSGRERTILLASITLAGFLGAFTVSSLNVALPKIEAQFHLSAVALSWIPLAYVLATAAVLMPSGRVADRWGHRAAFNWSLRVFALVLLATGFAPSAGALLALRALQGIPGAIVITASTAMVTFAYPVENRGRALGLFALGPYLGLTLGPVIGGVVIQAAGWRTLFFITGGLAVINCLFPTWKRGTDWQEPKRAGFDVLGSAMYAVALPVALLGLTLLPRWYGAVLVVAGAIGLALFVRWEQRAADPVLNVGLLRRNRVFASANAAAFINYAATLAVTFLMNLYLQYTRGLDPRSAGFVLIAQAVVQAAFSPLAGRWADRFQARYVAATGMGLCVAALVALAFLGEDTSYWYMVLVLCVLGLGFAVFVSPITHVVMGSVDKKHVGVASATLASLRWAGQNLSFGIAGLILAFTIGGHVIEPADYPRVLGSVRISFVVFAVLCLAGDVALLAGTARGRAVTPPDIRPQVPGA